MLSCPAYLLSRQCAHSGILRAGAFARCLCPNAACHLYARGAADSACDGNDTTTAHAATHRAAPRDPNAAPNVDRHADSDGNRGSADEHARAALAHEYPYSTASHEYGGAAPTDDYAASAGGANGDICSAECDRCATDFHHGPRTAVPDCDTEPADLYALSDPDPVSDHRSGATACRAPPTGTPRTAGSSGTTGTTCAHRGTALTYVDSVPDLYPVWGCSHPALHPAHGWKQRRVRW